MELTEALNGRFTAHHAFMTRLFLDRIDAHTKDIELLSERIDGLMAPFLPARDLLESIPGFSQTVAEVFIAETGGQMRQFPTPEQLASWAGVSPGSNESAGRVKSTKTRPGNRYLKGALGVAALNQARSKSKKTYFSAKFRHLAPTRGPMKAIVAVERAMLVAAWHMLQNGDFYRDPGADYYTRRDPARTKARAVKQLEALGYTVTILRRSDLVPPGMPTGSPSSAWARAAKHRRPMRRTSRGLRPASPASGPANDLRVTQPGQPIAPGVRPGVSDVHHQ